MYKLVDYHTDKQITDQTFNTESGAELGKRVYLEYCRANKVIHNNLILIRKV